MKNTIHQNKAKTLNDKIFWRCYSVEKAIGEILSYRVNFLTGKMLGCALIIISLFLATSPIVVSAEQGLASQIKTDLSPINLVFAKTEEKPVPLENVPIRLPRSQTRSAQQSLKVDITFYSSTPDQTDSTPFIAANGTHVFDGMVATNFLPFGTRIKIPEIYGDKVFVVHDRMNKRYWKRVDVWVATRADALAKGKYHTTIEIY